MTRAERAVIEAARRWARAPMAHASSCLCVGCYDARLLVRRVKLLILDERTRSKRNRTKGAKRP